MYNYLLLFYLFIYLYVIDDRVKQRNKNRIINNIK